MGYWDDTPFEELIGKTIVGVTGMEAGSEEVRFTCDDGSEYVMFHRQQCCEEVRLEEVHGEAGDLIGSPVLMAEAVTNEGGGPRPRYEVDGHRWYAASWTWTFYKLATAKGYVTLRWLGESNGYYSEEASFRRVEAR